MCLKVLFLSTNILRRAEQRKIEGHFKSLKKDCNHKALCFHQDHVRAQKLRIQQLFLPFYSLMDRVVQWSLRGNTQPSRNFKTKS